MDARFNAAPSHRRGLHAAIALLVVVPLGLAGAAIAPTMRHSGGHAALYLFIMVGYLCGFAWCVAVAVIATKLIRGEIRHRRR